MYNFERYTENKAALIKSMDVTKSKILELENFGMDVSASIEKIENAKIGYAELIGVLNRFPEAISNLWANDDVVANIVMEYEADIMMTKIDNYAEANLKTDQTAGVKLTSYHDGVGTVTLVNE